MLAGNANNAPTSTLVDLPSGLAGVRSTLHYMVGLVRQYRTDLNVRTLAIELTRDCPEKDARAEVTALQRFCRDKIKYMRDIDEVETLQTPVQTLKLGVGDCDDKATLLGALLGSIGYPSRFCAIGVRGEFYSHVMCQARLGRGWVNCETIVKDVDIGWFPPDATSFMLAHV